MPKIEEIEDTPNPNAMKFTLKEPLTWGITRSYENAGQAKDDPLAAALFDIEHVANVFYVDRWLTVTQDGDTDMTTKTTSLTAATKHPQTNKEVASRPSATRSILPQHRQAAFSFFTNEGTPTDAKLDYTRTGRMAPKCSARETCITRCT